MLIAMKTKLKVRKMWHDTHDADMLISHVKELDFGHPCLVITNLPKGMTAAKVGRLVEITPTVLAKAVFETCNPRITWEGNPQCHDSFTKQAARIMEALGLSSPTLTPPARRKDGKK